MIIIPFAILDLLAGFFLLAPDLLVGVAFWVGVLLIIKGVISYLGGALSGFFFDVLGIIDIIAGLSILFLWPIPWLWLIVIIKGVYSLFIGLISR